jgi:hypothetical protein
MLFDMIDISGAGLKMGEIIGRGCHFMSCHVMLVPPFRFLGVSRGGGGGEFRRKEAMEVRFSTFSTYGFLLHRHH